jgi:hypothetical protein
MLMQEADLQIRGPVLRATWSDVTASWAKLAADRTRRLAESRKQMLAEGVDTRASADGYDQLEATTSLGAADLAAQFVGLPSLTDEASRQYRNLLRASIWKIGKAEVDHKRTSGIAHPAITDSPGPSSTWQARCHSYSRSYSLVNA